MRGCGCWLAMLVRIHTASPVGIGEAVWYGGFLEDDFVNLSAAGYGVFIIVLN